MDTEDVLGFDVSGAFDRRSVPSEGMLENQRLRAELRSAAAERDQLREKMDRALAAVAHFTWRYNDDIMSTIAMRDALLLIASRTCFSNCKNRYVGGNYRRCASCVANEALGL